MRFELIIDERAEETVTATVHRRSALTDELEALVLRLSEENDKLMSARAAEILTGDAQEMQPA